MEIPKDRIENLRWRNKALRRAAEDVGFRGMLKEMFFRDIFFAFNGFFYTYDPRKRPLHEIPFSVWDFQEEELLEVKEHITKGKDLVIEKTRDMGVTWIVALTFFYEWLNPLGGADFLLGSRIEDYVDRTGDPRTLFHKLRYALYRLPWWLKPKGFIRGKHDNYMRLWNPETGAVIGGESNNANFSTGGRYAAVLFDEFAKWESTDESAWTAAGDATPCRIAVSTSFGAAGQFYGLVTDGRTKRLTLHWKLHPEKALGVSCIWPPPNEEDKTQMGKDWEPDEKLTSPWYEKECERRSPTEIAQELDIDYIGSGNPVFDGKAGISLRFYHKLKEEPILWGKLKLEELEIELLSEAPFSEEGHLIIYNKFNPKYQYTTGWDIVEGVEGGDYLFGTVLNRITKDVDAIYWSQFDEVLASRIIKIIQDTYSPEPDSADSPWCGIETTGPGLSTFDLCILLGVVNLFMAPRYDTVKGGVSYKKGWRTDTSSRNELISGIRQYLIGRTGKINSQRIVGELMTFVRSKTGKAQAKSGAHDDGVISFGITLQVDEIAPLDYEVAKEARPEYDPMAIREFNREEHTVEEDISIEGRCLATALQKKALEDREEVAFYGEDW